MSTKKPRFYYMDLDNYNEAHLKNIILYQKEVIENIRKIVGYNKHKDIKKENNKGMEVCKYLLKEGF